MASSGLGRYCLVVIVSHFIFFNHDDVGRSGVCDERGVLSLIFKNSETGVELGWGGGE